MIRTLAYSFCKCGKVKNDGGIYKERKDWNTGIQLKKGRTCVVLIWRRPGLLSTLWKLQIPTTNRSTEASCTVELFCVFLVSNSKPRIRLAIFLFRYSMLWLKPGVLSFRYDILLFRFPVLQSNFLFDNSDTLFGYWNIHCFNSKEHFFDSVMLFFYSNVQSFVLKMFLY